MIYSIYRTLHTAVFDDVPASLFSLSYIARSLTDKLGCSAGELYTTNMKINDHSTPKLPEIKWKKIVQSNVPSRFIYRLLLKVINDRIQLLFQVIILFCLFVCFFLSLMMFNATFNNMSVISWRSVLLVEEAGGLGENHRPVASHWQTLLHNVVHLALAPAPQNLSMYLNLGIFSNKELSQSNLSISLFENILRLK